MNTVKFTTLVLLSVVLNRAPGVSGHGRLIEPPSRSTMWRYGFSTPPNYNDHELYCGGFSRQWRTNDGKCGICGDPWDSKQPRPNEAGGLYGRGVIARKYSVSSSIKVRVELTANHMGYFEFRLCPNNNMKRAATQACLDQHVLKSARTGDSRYYPGEGTKVFEMLLQLPNGLTCTQCVFQWRYVAGNNWGMCKNGTGAVGCGPQEEFRACADVSITKEDGSADDLPNTLFDDEVYGPIDEDDEEYNEVDVDHVVEEEYDSGLGILWMVLLGLLITATMFALVFLYFLRGRDLVKTLNKQTRSLDARWPLLTHAKKIPVYLHKKASVINSSSNNNNNNDNIVVSVVSNSKNVTQGMTRPTVPPRAKRPAPLPTVTNTTRSSSSSSSLATVSSRPRVLRPTGPPPQAPVISEPSNAIINGVSVEDADLVAARLVMADENMPDSMENQGNTQDAQ